MRFILVSEFPIADRREELRACEIWHQVPQRRVLFCAPAVRAAASANGRCATCVQIACCTRLLREPSKHQQPLSRVRGRLCSTLLRLRLRHKCCFSPLFFLSRPPARRHRPPSAPRPRSPALLVSARYSASRTHTHTHNHNLSFLRPQMV